MVPGIYDLNYIPEYHGVSLLLTGQQRLLVFSHHGGSGCLCRALGSGIQDGFRVLGQGPDERHD